MLKQNEFAQHLIQKSENISDLNKELEDIKNSVTEKVQKNDSLKVQVAQKNAY